MEPFTLSYGFNQIDFDKVTSMLEKVWWSPGIKKAEVIRGAENSALLVGAFDLQNLQIGYARVVSDKTRFAYIMDVVVDERHRRLGIGQAMISYILNHPELKNVYQWVLLTKDAHGVYSKMGFKALASPENWMEIRKERPVR